MRRSVAQGSHVKSKPPRVPLIRNPLREGCPLGRQLSRNLDFSLSKRYTEGKSVPARAFTIRPVAWLHDSFY